MIRTTHAHLPVFAVTHPGMSGKENEDRYAVSAFQISPADSTPTLLAVLADGIGGHRAGEVAAEIAVESISHQVAAGDTHHPLQTLTTAIYLASQKILASAQSDENRIGMGSTCSCVWVINCRLYTATVGDSRIYLLRGGQITQLSTDHTWIQEAVERGILTPDQVRGHPNQHIIRRYLGSPTPPAVDFRMRLSPTSEPSEAHQGLSLLPDDRLLLCSDGLTDLVGDAEILAMIDSNEPSAALQSLVDLANERGGHDNITIVMLHAPQQSYNVPPPSTKKLPLLRITAVVVLLAALAGAVLGILTLINPITTPQPASTPTVTLPSSIPILQPTFPQAAPSQVAATPIGIAPVLPAAPTASPFPITPTFPALSTRSGATITPWPTNTLKP